MYKVVGSLKEIGRYESFKDAILALFKYVREEVRDYMTLEQCCWIQKDDCFPMNFYDARDKAYEMNLITEEEISGKAD